MLDEMLRHLFKTRYSEWRPLSASVADGIVIHALTQVNDSILATPPPLGHPTWHEKGYAGFRGLKITDIPFDWNNLEIDYEKLGEISGSRKFSIAIEGRSLILFPPDFRLLVEKLMGTPLWYDGAHVMGLIASGLFPNPIDFGASVLSGSTQKTLSGPLGGVILSNDDEAMESIRSATANDTATPDYGRIAGLAATMIEWNYIGKSFAADIIGNARMLAESLHDEGLGVLMEDRGFTKTHQIALLCPGHIDANHGAKMLSAANILTTPFPIPDGNGGTRQVLRLGTTEITRTGFDRHHMPLIAKAIAAAFKDNKEAIARVKSIVASLPKRS